VAGAEPPVVFKRWMKVVSLKPTRPERPVFDPVVSSKRQGIAPVWEQLGSEPESTPGVSAFAHTTLPSRELRHVGLPKGGGAEDGLGLVFGLRK
jgi:hypothetical protein